MADQDATAARVYHERTKHTYWSVRSHGGLDWANQPMPYKIYPDLEPLPLPEPPAIEALSALDAVAGEASVRSRAIPSVEDLTAILHYSAGITKTIKHAGGEMPFRAASCTGALYHIDLYLVSGSLPDLPAGVYHYGVHDHSLRKLRDGDHRAVLVRATAGESAVASAPAILVAASTYWRNAWKYQERAYRHCFWDAGTILANLLAVTASLSLPVRLTLGFADPDVESLLGLDPLREGAIAVVALGAEEGGTPRPEDRGLTPISHATHPLSASEVEYPSIREMHAASSLEDANAVQAWRAGGTPERMESKGPTPLKFLEETPRDGVFAVVRRRGSSRRFSQSAMSLEQLSTLLTRSTGPIPAGLMGGLNDLYLIVNAVEGLESGTYFYHRWSRSLELLRAGDFRAHAGHLGLDQALPADAAVNVYYMTDLEGVFARRGNRGYRAAQLEAGILGGKLYLAAYALRLGATGLTFYDDDVTAFFSPHAAGKSPMFLMAVGVPAPRGG